MAIPGRPRPGIAAAWCVRQHMIATEELGESACAAPLPKLRVYGDTRKVLYYFPPLARLQAHPLRRPRRFVDADTKRSGATLHRAMTDLIPDLEGTKITHSWKGNVAFAFDMLPHVGVEEGVHYTHGLQWQRRRR